MSRLNPILLFILLSVLSLILILVGASVGSTGLNGISELKNNPLALQIFWDIRLPRTLGAWLIGALLGLSGVIAQGLFRNPLADPYLLGSASGASLAVAVAYSYLGLQFSGLNGWFHLGLTGSAFLGSLGAVFLTLGFARGLQNTLRLLLAGVVVGVLLGALTSLITLTHPEVLQTMQGFLLGSTAFLSWSSSAVMSVCLGLCLLLAFVFSRLLDALLLGETTTLSLGLPIAPMRFFLILAMSLAIGTAVAQAGLIAFVGLAAPHLVRSLTKTTHAWLVFLGALMGGCVLLGSDILGRYLLAPQELPVGILTAGLGGGYLLYLMHRNK